MNGQLYEIKALDAIMFRDGRPFSNEGSSLIARSLPLPLPGTVTGFLRTQLGNRLGWDWSNDGPSKAMGIAVQGPLLLRNGKPVFSKPADALMAPYETDPDRKARAIPLCPSETAQSRSNAPRGLAPCVAAKQFHDKPARGFNLWEWDTMARWLENPMDPDFPPLDKILGLPREERAHTRIGVNGTAMEGMLYTTEFLRFEDHLWNNEERHDEWSLLAKVGEMDTDLTGAGTLGGEMRIAFVNRVENHAFPPCPHSLKGKLESGETLRMILATPAIFSDGWKPGWLDTNLEGTPPFPDAPRLKLVSAVVERRTAVSGWDYAKRGPKPVRWLAPAGSVYFFETLSGNVRSLTEEGWLSPVSDQEQDRRDGYGLALWGVYDMQTLTNTDKKEK